jgi:hypothetical protein
MEALGFPAEIPSFDRAFAALAPRWPRRALAKIAEIAYLIDRSLHYFSTLPPFKDRKFYRSSPPPYTVEIRKKLRLNCYFPLSPNTAAADSHF